MATDYGGGRRRTGIRTPAIIAAAAVLIVAFIVGDWAWRRPMEIEKAQQWAISGAPCPELTKPGYEAQPERIRNRSEVNDNTFGWNAGAISCEDIVNDGGKGFGKFTECQFSSPGVIEVTTGAGDFYFLPKLGRATVTVKKGRARCVRAGWFAGAAD